MSADNIKVAIRVRPLIARELRSTGVPQWKIQEKTSIFQIDEAGQAVGEVFAFDRIFEPDESNQFIYETLVESFIKATLSGVNSTVFAYGQTSSGKTYTMLGDENNPGIMTLAVKDIFAAIEASSGRKYLVRVAYLEIYNEKVIDLLGNPSDKVHVREVGGSVNLINLTETIVSTPEQVLDWLRVGTANRQFGETNLNERSSRSHTIFKILIESTDVQDSDSPIQQSTINLVDLAGSERASQTKATGVRLFEGSHINKSLSTLSLVIRQITEGREFVNFRDSKLTQILRNSLGGNSKTLIIANVTIASVENTLSTLLFAQTAKTIKCKPQINEVLSDAALSKRYAFLSDDYKRQLEDQLKTNQDLELDKETKTKTIEHLQMVIQNLEYFANHSLDRASDSGAVPKRRHTICTLGRNGNQPLLPIREGVTMESFELRNFESTTTSTYPEIAEIERTAEEADAETSPDSTPKSVLRKRLDILQEEHHELVRFTRDEKNVRKQEQEKAMRELETRLKVLQRQFEDETKIAEAKIDTLNDQLSIKTSENEFVVAQLKAKFKKREDELVSEIDRLKVAEDSTAVQTPPETELLSDLFVLQDILVRATDEASIDERVIRSLDENAEQMTMLKFVFDNLKLLCESQNVTEIARGDCYKMHFLLDADENKTDALNFVHQLCLQFIRMFDIIKYSSNSEPNKLNYAQAELKDAMFILHNEEKILWNTLLPILTRCRDLVENYAKANCASGKIDCWNTALQSFLNEPEYSDVDGFKKLSVKLTEQIREYNEQQILTFLNRYSSLCSGLKQFEECNACLVKRNSKLAIEHDEKDSVIEDLMSKLTYLNMELHEEKVKKCENCESFKDQIKTIMNDLQQQKQGCQAFESIEVQMKTAMADLEQEKQALHLGNENLKCEIKKYQSDIDRLNNEINSNTKFNRDMVESHSNIVDGFKAQIEVLEQKVCESNVANERELELKSRIDDLNRKLCSNEEIRNCMVVEHSTVVKDLKSQIEVLEQKVCESNVANERELELKSRIDDLNRKLCSNEEIRSCMVVEHSTVVKDLKSQIEVLQQSLSDCDIAQKKDMDIFKLRMDKLIAEQCSNEEIKNNMIIEHKQAVLAFESKIERLMRQHDSDLQVQAETLNKNHEKVVDDLKSQVTALKIKTDRMTLDRQGLVNDYNEKLKRLKCEIEEQASEKQSDQVKFKISRTMILEHKNTIKSLRCQISDMENALQSSHDMKNKMSFDHKNEMEMLELQVESLEKELQSSSTLKSQVDMLMAKVKEMRLEYKQMVGMYESRLTNLQCDIDKQSLLKLDHDKRVAKVSSRLQGLELEVAQTQQLLNVANSKNAELEKQLKMVEGERIENDKLRRAVKELQCKVNFFQKEQIQREEHEKDRKMPVADREMHLKEEQLNKSNSEMSLSRRVNEVNLKTTGIIVGQGKENSDTNCKDCSKYRDHLKEQMKTNGFLRENLKLAKSKSDSWAASLEERMQTVDSLKRNVDQLNAKNRALTVKIQELESAKSECASCAKWRDEVKARQREIAGLTRKLVDVQAEYYSLQKTQYSQYQKSELAQFLEDKNELQSRNEKLTKKMKEMKADCQVKTEAASACSRVEMATKEVQCDISDDGEAKYNILFEKYKLTKHVAIMRKEQIDDLTKKLGQQ